MFLQVENRYLKRIEQFLRAERVTVPDLKKVDARQQSAQWEREARSIDRKLSAGTYLVVADHDGEELTSAGLASFLMDLLNRSVPEVTFIVGGHLGIPSRIKDVADRKLSLTKLTLPHELARIVLIEQIYRALSLVRGLPYHK